MSDPEHDPEHDNDPNDLGDETPDDTTGDAAKAAAIIGGVFALVALAVQGPRAAISVLVGAAMGVANLLTMRAIIRALIRVPGTGEGQSGDGQSGEGQSGQSDGQSAEKKTGQAAGVAWALFAALKILILFGGIWFLLTRRLVDPMPLVVGYGVLPLGIAAAAVWSSLAQRPPR